MFKGCNLIRLNGVCLGEATIITKKMNILPLHTCLALLLNPSLPVSHVELSFP